MTLRSMIQLSPIVRDLRHAPPRPFGLRPSASRNDTEAACGRHEISAHLWPFICFIKTRTVLVFKWGSSFAEAMEDKTTQDRSRLDGQIVSPMKGQQFRVPANAGFGVWRTRQARRAERARRRASSSLEDARRLALSRRRKPTDAHARFSGRAAGARRRVADQQLRLKDAEPKAPGIVCAARV